MSDVSTWSTTAGNNNTASPDGFPEDMPPSGVNNSARENMAAIATWRQKLNPAALENVGISASVASNDLTVALKNKGGSDPSTTNKVGASFRSNTLTSGQWSWVDFTAAASVTLPAGGTLGFASSESNYICVVAAYDGTNKEIGLTCLPPDEGVLHSTTAIGTGSDATNVIYTTSALTNAAVRLIGRIKITHGSSVWDSAPTEVAVWSENMTREFEKYIELGGSFTAGKQIRLTAKKTTRGTRCRVSWNTELTHSSSSAPASAAGIIPSEYRPATVDQYNEFATTAIHRAAAITTAGTFKFDYRDSANAGTSTTSASFGGDVVWDIDD